MVGMVTEVRTEICTIKVYRACEDKVIVKIEEKENVNYDFLDDVEGYKIIIERKR